MARNILINIVGFILLLMLVVVRKRPDVHIETFDLVWAYWIGAFQMAALWLSDTL